MRANLNRLVNPFFFPFVVFLFETRLTGFMCQWTPGAELFFFGGHRNAMRGWPSLFFFFFFFSVIWSWTSSLLFCGKRKSYRQFRSSFYENCECNAPARLFRALFGEAGHFFFFFTRVNCVLVSPGGVTAKVAAPPGFPPFLPLLKLGPIGAPLFSFLFSAVLLDKKIPWFLPFSKQER